MNPIRVELHYPRVEGNKDCVIIDLTDVRASDGIRIHYDFKRDGWVICQPRYSQVPVYKSDGKTVDYYMEKEEWIETAFVQSWPFEVG
jgi:hypothetical protein